MIVYFRNSETDIFKLFVLPYISLNIDRFNFGKIMMKNAIHSIIPDERTQTFKWHTPP